MYKNILQILFRHFGTIQSARETDVEQLFYLSNDQTVRRYSLNHKKIKWESHMRWFKERLSNNNYVIYIIELFGYFIGQVRFKIDRSRREAVISVSLTSKARGLGLSSLVIQKALLLFRRYHVPIIKAYILKDNVISEKSFQRAGFIYDKSTCMKNQKVKIFIKNI